MIQFVYGRWQVADLKGLLRSMRVVWLEVDLPLGNGPCFSQPWRGGGAQ